MGDLLEVPIRFGWRWIIFFILLETSTVPLVAMSNDVAIQNMLYMSIMGFIVAFICVLLLILVLKRLIIHYSLELFGVKFSQVVGVWYIAILAGILEMVMFAVQDLLFHRGWGDYSVGFISAFISVGVSLLLYRLSVHLLGMAIKLRTQENEYSLNFMSVDIVKLALMFGLYELIVCPITGWWIPFHEHRLIIAILSGIVGGGSGGALVWLISSQLKGLNPKLSFIKTGGV